MSFDLNVGRVVSLFISAAAVIFNAVGYSTNCWSKLINVPVNRFNLPLILKDEFYLDKDCRNPVSHLLQQRHEAQLDAIVYRGLLKRCEEVRKRIGKDPNVIECELTSEKSPETVIVQRLIVAAMVFQAIAVCCGLTILAIVRMPDSQRKLAAFLGVMFPSVLGALMTGLGLLVYSQHLLPDEMLDYSFLMAGISSVLSLVTVFLLTGDMFRCPPSHRFNRRPFNRPQNPVDSVAMTGLVAPPQSQQQQQQPPLPQTPQPTNAVQQEPNKADLATPNAKNAQSYDDSIVSQPVADSSRKSSVDHPTAPIGFVPRPPPVT